MGKASFLMLIALISTQSWAQVISGTWKGELTQEIGAPYTDYNYKIDISVKDKIVSGTSTIWLKTDTNIAATMKLEGTYEKGALFFKESILDSNDLEEGKFSWCLKTGTLYLTKESNQNYLKGNWTGKVPWGDCKPGTISIKKTDKEPEEQKLEERNILANKVVYVKSDSISIKLYDHKRIDNDIISLKYNDQWIVKNYVLTGKPLVIKLKVGKKDANKLLMYAHNLGSIPPNTAALEVIDEMNEQKLKLQSNLKESDSVDIIYKP